METVFKIPTFSNHILWGTQLGQGCVKKLLINYLFQKTVSAHHWRGAQGAALRKASQMRRKILIVCPSKNKTTTTTTIQQQLQQQQQNTSPGASFDRLQHAVQILCLSFSHWRTSPSSPTPWRWSSRRGERSCHYLPGNSGRWEEALVWQRGRLFLLLGNQEVLPYPSPLAISCRYNKAPSTFVDQSPILI